MVGIKSVLNDESSYLSDLSTCLVGSILLDAKSWITEESLAAGLTGSGSTFCISALSLRVTGSKFYKNKN